MATAAGKRVVALLGTPIYNEDGSAAEAITPGHLVSGVTSIVKHATAAGAARRTFALERDEMGKDMDQAYAVGDTVKVGSFCPGQRVNALIASGVSVTAGTTFLESAGDGTLRAFTSGVRVAVALETKTAAFTGQTRLRVEVY